MSRAVPAVATGLAALVGGPVGGLAALGGFKLAQQLGADTSLGLDDQALFDPSPSFADILDQAQSELGDDATPAEIEARAREIEAEERAKGEVGGLPSLWGGDGGGDRPRSDFGADREHNEYATETPWWQRDDIALAGRSSASRTADDAAAPSAPAGPGGQRLERTIHPLDTELYGTYARPGGLSEHRFIRYGYGD